MNILSLRNVVKRYRNHIAVNDVSFDVPKASIFGLLGPNGAGKTSIIRIITTITAADEGEVLFDGKKLSGYSPAEIGYLPEERGLYRKMKVGEQLLYLAQLKGLSRTDAIKNINYWYDKFDIADWSDKRIEELSKGMQQKVQFIATVVHKPKLIILDEPFTGLDPINTNLIKNEIYNLNKEGTSIIFSTHRMEQVEEVCTDIVLINSGKKILEGKVEDVKNNFKENLFKIEFEGTLPMNILPEGFILVESNIDDITVKVKEGHNGNELLSAFLSNGVFVKSYQEILPTLNEIFIINVEGKTDE